MGEDNTKAETPVDADAVAETTTDTAGTDPEETPGKTADECEAE